MKYTIFSHKILFALLAFALSITVIAKPRTQQQKLEAAGKILQRQTTTANGQHRVQATQQLQVLGEDDMLTVVGYKGGGYAIVTNDDLLPEVVGYSASTFAQEQENENFKWWCSMMRLSAQELVKQGTPAKVTRPDTNKFQAQVPQMLTTSWGQMEPFNNQCPLEYNKNGKVVGRTLVGCVATAATQVMNYLQYPTQGTGKHTDMQTNDAWGKPRPITVDFADYTFDYSLLQDTYTPGSYDKQEADEVAKLSYTVGVSFGMIYGTAASGTYLDSAAISLKKYLGFSKAQYYTRGNYDEPQWMNLIYQELSNGRPIVYGGADDLFTEGGGGHCFVFDGYDQRGLVHVNWGWYGKNDGYYDVSLLNPRIHSFKNSQDMIVGLDVPTSTSDADKNLVLSGEVSDATLYNIIERSKSEGLRKVDLSDATLVDGILPAKAFYGSRLQTIVLPANIKQIGDGAFGACRNLTEVRFPEASDDQQFLVEDNIIYTRDGKEVIEVLPYYQNSKLVIENFNSLLTFREGITDIHSHAMDGCFRVKGVVIPATVERIGKRVFANASSIKQIQSKTSTPALAQATAFSALDAGYTRLVIPAGTWDVYSRSGEWRHFFSLDNVSETGTNIKARNIVRMVGEKNPELRFQIFGEYVTGEPTLRCEADEFSPTGEYPIIVEMGTITANDVVLTNGVMRVVDNADTLEDIIADEHTDVAIYRLDGQKVSDNHIQTHGIYIINGKKTLR